MLLRLTGWHLIAVLALAGEDRYFDLLHISDTHVARFPGVHPELIHARTLFRGTGAQLERFVAEAAQIPNSRVVHTGDIVDAVCFDGDEGRPPVYGQIEFIQKLLAPLPQPPLLVLGNHDVECYRRDPKKRDTAVGDQSVAAESRRLWGKAFPALSKGTYYSERITIAGRTYWLIALDNGESLAGAGQRFFDQQMRWFERELKRRADDPAIVALHIPIANDSKSESIKQRLARSDRVRLILTGHRHSDLIDTVEAGARRIRQVRTAGMQYTASNWRRIRLHADRLEISATGSPEKLLDTIPLPGNQAASNLRKEVSAAHR